MHPPTQEFGRFAQAKQILTGDLAVRTAVYLESLNDCVDSVVQLRGKSVVICFSDGTLKITGQSGGVAEVRRIFQREWLLLDEQLSRDVAGRR